MPSTITAEKARLRAALTARLHSLSLQERQTSDDRLFARFLSLPQVIRANTLLLYCGMGTEPDTRRLFAPLRAMGKAFCLPRCLQKHQMEVRLAAEGSPLVPHPYGMLEPGPDCPLVTAAQIDLVLVPGLAFDRQGGRLGRGGGYYDRWLAGYSGITVALCRDTVLVERLPVESHDWPVDLVVTETGLYGPSRTRHTESGA